MINAKKLLLLCLFIQLQSLLKAQSPLAYPVDLKRTAAVDSFDIPALRKLVGSLDIVPFFLPASNAFWYVWEDTPGVRKYWLADPVAKTKTPIPGPDPGPKQPVKYRGVGEHTFNDRYILYSKGHELYLQRDSVEAKRLSADGARYYSFAEYEADERADRPAATVARWVDSSAFFYALREDNRKVFEMPLVHSMPSHPWLEKWKYQLAGDTAVTQYELFIGDTSGRINKVGIEKWKDQELKIIGANPVFNEVFFTRKSRTGQQIELCAAHLVSGKIRVIIAETTDRYFSPDLFQVISVNNGNEWLWWSDRSGWGHFYLYDRNGHLKRTLTKGAWTAARKVRLDERGRKLYFYGYGKESGRNPNLQHLYEVSLEGGTVTLHTKENAHHKVWFHPQGKYYIDVFSRIDQSPQITVRSLAGKLLMELEKPDVSRLYGYGWRHPEPFTVKAADDSTLLYGLIWKPSGFDSTKKYPVISQVYPGPFTETVWPDFTVFDKYNNAALAQAGFIVVVMGHRGSSPFRGKVYATYGYGNLRDYALKDDRHGLRELMRGKTYMDSTRIGIIGHSGGGAMAAAAICTYPEFYKAAVASAGNHDNAFYHKSWGETYQGIAYDSTKAKPFNYKVKNNMELASRLAGRLLLVTGETDNNVHPGNTFRLVDALVKAGKNFELLVLPNQSHHYEGPYKTYYENKVRAFFLQYL